MTLLSVDRALTVIEILTDRGHVGVSELATKLCVAPSTIHRVLATLEDRHFVVQDEDRRYRPGPKMVAMSLEIELVERARRSVAGLGAVTGMTVHIGTLEGPEVRYMHHWAPRVKRAVGDRVGTRMNAQSTSAGKALLATLPREQVISTFPRPVLDASTPTSIKDRGTLFKELQLVRTTGYARNIEESEVGVVGLAIPISHPRQALALSVSAWLRDMPVERDKVVDAEARIVDELMAAGGRLEAAFQLA